MEQLTMLSQYDIDKGRFIELLSNFTGISKSKISNFLDHNSINTIFEHSTALDITNSQRDKLYQLRELRNLYQNLKSYNKDYIIDSPTRAGEYFKEYFSGAKDKEYFVCSLLDNHNRIIATKVITTGTVNEAPVYPREIAKTALLYDTNSVILAHNHPGGSLIPSRPDINVTESITNALSLLKIRVMDHIIVGDDKFTSFMEKGISLSPNYSIAESNKLNDIKDKVINTYKEELPAIKYISEKTASIITTMNKTNGYALSIKEIKNIYTETGKRLETDNSKEDIEKFEELTIVVDDIKQANFTLKQEQAHEKANHNQINNAMEII
jgi:DNA repair protein RadC